VAKVKILFIDDEVDYCLLMKNFFTNKNYDVYIANSLTDGLKNLESARPEILFLDNNLPDGKGWDKVPEIVENYPQLKIYLASAYYKGENLFTDFPQVTIWEKPLSLELLIKQF
jgi:DNA-binding NtrC family response regulator